MLQVGVIDCSRHGGGVDGMIAEGDIAGSQDNGITGANNILTDFPGERHCAVRWQHCRGIR